MLLEAISLSWRTIANKLEMVYSEFEISTKVIDRPYEKFLIKAFIQELKLWIKN
ncbi:hypothetical protein HYE19_02360 [Mycoplasmopsis bovis]|nr:hypothetical protein [Mycoplasmopsis bovis]QQH24857.1 hypothetical protein HYE19_02360 [Mycoplasmopsis bovis]